MNPTSTTSTFDPMGGSAWACSLGFKSGVEYPTTHIGRNNLNVAMARTRLLTVPGSPHYLPPLIPDRKGWLESVQSLAGLSFRALVADIWTQLLILKRDHRERPIYLLWDGEIPKPNALSALAWLLTCETWPMLTHKQPDGTPLLNELFPAQSFVMPQSTPYGYASSRPHGFAEGLSGFEGKGLTGLLTQAMHREDRGRMEFVKEKSQVHRPQTQNVTCFDLHLGNRLVHGEWSHREGWPHTSTKYYDQNMAAREWQESDEHAAALRSLRADVMKELLVIPGLPSHRDNLHFSAGMWIRGWSEIGIITKIPAEHMQWTPDSNAIVLADGKRLTHIPQATPRIWFGWSHIGPKYEVDPAIQTERRVTSDSEEWAAAYLRHRPHALRMLFQPESIDRAKLIEDTASTRAKQLGRAGRLKATAIGTESKSSISAAFQQFMYNAPKIED